MATALSCSSLREQLRAVATTTPSQKAPVLAEVFWFWPAQAGHQVETQVTTTRRKWADRSGARTSTQFLDANAQELHVILKSTARGVFRHGPGEEHPKAVLACSVRQRLTRGALRHLPSLRGPR